MKKILILVVVLVLTFNFYDLIGFSSGIINYYNNNQGGSCLNCHSNVGGSTQLSILFPSGGVVPNGLYLGTVSGMDSGAQIFGINLVAHDGNGNNYGDLIPFDSLKTQVISRNLTHQKDGGIAQDSIQFKFYWRAPSTISSNSVIFKWNVLCGNYDGGINGDRVANGNKMVSLLPNETSALSKSLLVFPNPATEHLTLTNLIGTEQILMYNSSGKLVYSIKNSHHETVVIPLDGFEAGIYYISSEHGKSIFIKR
jgi:hypothetical protein